LTVAFATVGSSLIGRPRYAMTPNRAMAAISMLVAMGRLMKVSETFMSAYVSYTVDSVPIQPAAIHGEQQIVAWFQDPPESTLEEEPEFVIILRQILPRGIRRTLRWRLFSKMIYRVKDRAFGESPSLLGQNGNPG
jgi:hypothetical protein